MSPFSNFEGEDSSRRRLSSFWSVIDVEIGKNDDYLAPLRTDSLSYRSGREWPK